MNRQNLMTGKGETFELHMTYLDSNDSPVNLTGHTIELVVSKASSGEPVGTYPGQVDTEGNIHIVVEDEVTDTWPVGKAAYRIHHTSPNGVERWLIWGALQIISGVDV